MAWYDTAVFYHIYPLGLCGCAHENDGQPTPGAFAKLNAWAEHASKDLGCTAIYIGPLFESGSHGYDTIDYRRVDRRLGTNEDFRKFVANCHARGQKVIVDGVCRTTIMTPSASGSMHSTLTASGWMQRMCWTSTL